PAVKQEFGAFRSGLPRKFTRKFSLHARDADGFRTTMNDVEAASSSDHGSARELSHRDDRDGAMEIELVRGTRRRKHVEAELVGDRLRVSFPRWMSLADAQEAAEELAERMRRRIDPARIDVAARARRLAREYGLPRPKRVQWSAHQQQR